MVTDYNEFFTEYAGTRQSVNTTLPYPGVNNIDVASWTNGSVTLVTAANFYLYEQDFLAQSRRRDFGCFVRKRHCGQWNRAIQYDGQLDSWSLGANVML